MEDLLFGLFLAALAVMVFVATRKLQVGSAADMGPGYFPQAIAWGMLVFGVFFVGKSWVIPGDPILPPHWLALILIPLAFALPVPWGGRAAMIASVLLVLIVELINSAIEAVVDRVSLDRHHLSKRAKDIGSAAVFLALLNVAVVWGCVLVS